MSDEVDVRKISVDREEAKKKANFRSDDLMICKTCRYFHSYEGDDDSGVCLGIDFSPYTEWCNTCDYYR